MAISLVTGANTGIGKATALELARRGDRVYLACRSAEKTQSAIDEIASATGNTDVHFLPLDLGDFDSVRACAAAFLDSGDALDLLVNNAGVAGLRGMTDSGFELAFGINHVGHFLLTTLLLDRIKASAPARIVTVSSTGHFQAGGIDYDAVRQPTKTQTALREYGVSKLANVLFSQELGRRLAGSGVTTYALHPGAIASDIWDRRLPGPLAAVVKFFMRSPEEGARTTLYCATSPDVAGDTGKYYDNCKEKAPSKVATPERAAELWAHSEAWVAGQP